MSAEPRRGWGVGRWAAAWLAAAMGMAVPASAQVFTPSAGSFLGGTGTADAVRGTRIQSDGTIVIAANISDANPGGVTPTLLNGATATTSGAIIRLAYHGRSVLSVTRLANDIWDLALDGAGNILVAASAQGVISLTPDASAINWQNTANGAAHRVDAGAGGEVAVLRGSFSNIDSAPSAAGTVFVYNAAGAQLGTFAGWRRTYDLAIDSASQSVFLTGYQQTSGPSGNPVQIAYIRAQAFDGTQKWKGYDWTGTQVDDPAAGGTGPTNNMADTRGVRISVGPDGYLYVGYMVAGGNHIFRYSPQDLFTPVSIVGGDKYHEFYNSKSEHKTFFGRYDPITGAYVLGQQWCARRLDNNQTNAARIDRGDILADENGVVYLAGDCASGDGTTKTTPGLPYTFNPVPGTEYGGGPFLLVMSADFTTRLFCGRVSSNGTSFGLAVGRPAGATFSNIVWGGKWTNYTLWTQGAIQPAASTSTDGFLALVTTATSFPPTVAITSPASGSSVPQGSPITLTATASDPDGSVSSVAFYDGATLIGTDSDGSNGWSVAWSGAAVGAHSVTAVATDNAGVSTTSDPVSLTVNVAGYRYLRLYITQRTNTSFVARITEVDWIVGSTDHPTVPMTANTTGSLVASGSVDAANAFKAYDNSTSTYWSFSTFPCTLTLDVNQPIAPTAVRIRVNTSFRAPRDFLIQGSNDGSTWTTLYTASGVTTWTNNVNTFTLP